MDAIISDLTTLHVDPCVSPRLDYATQSYIHSTFRKASPVL